MVNQVNDTGINVMEIFTIDSVNAGLPGLCTDAAEVEAEAAEVEAEVAGLDAAGLLTD